MNCDPIARAYRYLEYASFGPALQRRRCYFLPQLRASRRVLMLGEGDGRFLAEFVRHNKQAQVDCVDRSAKMLRVAQRRTQAARVRFHRRNLLSEDPPAGDYDTVITHFFLDCLSNEEVTALVEKTVPALTREANWIVSEFREPPCGWRRVRAKLWVAGLYQAFRIATKLSTRQLPDHGRAFHDAGFVLQKEKLASAGMLTSQLWSRASQSPCITLPISMDP